MGIGIAINAIKLIFLKELGGKSLQRCDPSHETFASEITQKTEEIDQGESYLYVKFSSKAFYIKGIHVGFLKAQEKRYLETLGADLKILKDVVCSVNLVGGTEGL